jgi:hypothetical protein
MPITLDIQAGSQRLQELADVFSFGSRRLLGDFSDLGVAWSDNRSKRFRGTHLEPQNEILAAGSESIRQHVVLANTADENSKIAEACLRAVYSKIAEAEAAVANAACLSRNADELTSRASGQARHVTSECQSLETQISAACFDGGW